jgi:hypothetical protein
MDAEISLEAKGCSTSYKAGTQNPDNYPHGKHTSTVPSGVDDKNLDVKELEMILEPYFVQVDGTLNKLSTVCKPPFFHSDPFSFRVSLFHT